MTEPLVVGIDLGTESVRVAAFDRRGRRVADARRVYATSFPMPGWAEQDAALWWPALSEAARDVAARVLGHEVVGVAVSTTASTVVVCDEHGRALRPAILWMDNRAVQEVGETSRSSHPVLRYSGGSDAVEWLVPKAMWLARHEPSVYDDAARIVEAVDFVNHRLTGRWTGSLLNATCKWNYDPAEGWHDDLYAELGVPELRDKLPEEIVPVGHSVGQLTEAAATDLGLPTGTPVFQGGIDAHLGMLGTNTLDDGRVNMVAGSSIVQLLLSPHELWSDGIWGPYPDALLEGTWLVEGGQVSAGSILRWYVYELLGAGEQGQATHRRLMEQAQTLPPGSEGLMICDFWQGNRTPYRDARLRGTVTGMSLHHGQAHLYRAIIEAVAFGSRNVFASFEAAGAGVGDVVVSGGIRDSPLWLQATADICGRELLLQRETNASLLGAAVCAAAGAGLSGTLRDAAAAMSETVEVVSPDPTHRAAYDELFARYLETVEATRALVRDEVPSA